MIDSNASYRTLTAFFRSRSDAEEAVSRLIAAGLSRDNIRLVPGQEAGSATIDRQQEHGGFWDSLADFFFPADDRTVYAEGLRRGGYLLSVDGIDEARHEQVLDILDDEGTIDIDEWSDSWRAEGWTPANPGFDRQTGSTAYAGTSGLTETADAGRMSDMTAGRDEAIPVVEEQLRVGKRDVNNGRVRVRSYVVETPVSETVSLRDENVSIERRSVDRPLSTADAAFTDRVIEAEEHHEEAVVAKEARVKEEVVVRKTANERTERVEDKVRHTEIDIEDERAALKKESNVFGAKPGKPQDSTFTPRH